MPARRRLIQVLSTLLVLIATLMLAPAASAAPLIGSNFDSQDGNQLPTAAAPIVRDWQTVAPAELLTTNIDTLSGGLDGCFIGGVKETVPNEWGFNTSADGCTPGKSDLLGMWSHAELTPTQTFLHASFIRKAGNGNTFITFELNKVGTTWANSIGTSIPCRSNGDLLVSYEVGGSTVDVTINRWTGTVPGPPSCPNGAEGAFATSLATSNGLMNTATIGNYLSAPTITALLGKATGDTAIEAALFGEAQINVSAVLGSMGITGCYSYLSAQAHTRTAQSLTSALIDNVPPAPTAVANCAVTGTVYGDANANAAQDSGETGTAGRTVYVDVDNDGTFDAGEPSAITDAQGYYLIPTTYTSGTYDIRVVVPAAMVCTAPVTTCANAATFTAGGNDVANNFGLLIPATVSGTAYVDANANGVRDAGENTPIAGSTVYNDANDNGTLDAGESTTTTAADGSYTVGGLAPGTARVRFVNSNGYICDAPAGCVYTQVVAGADNVTGKDFLAFQSPTVSGTVFDDANANAVKDAGEPGRGSVTVRLYAADATTLLATTTTDPSGTYTFSGLNPVALTPGSYVISVDAPAGFACSDTCDTAVTLTSGQTLTGQNAGLYQTATVSGTVFADGDLDGIMDAGELPQSGVVIYADTNNNGVPDAGEPASTTDALGTYTLTGVAPGSAHIRATLVAAFACSTPTDCDHTLTLTSGQTVTGRDFGIVPSATAGGTVATDNDADGTVDVGEPPLAGWTVYIDTNANGRPDAGEPAAITAADGSYAITNVTPGTHTLRVDRPTGWTCSSPCSQSITLTSGDTRSALDFTLYEPVGITGTVFDDASNDAIRQVSESGLGARTVYLDANADGAFDVGEENVATQADGSYAFSDLPPGEHRVRVIPAGRICTTPSPCRFDRTLASGSVSSSNTFGLFREPVADLSLTKTAPVAVQQGTTFEYTLSVSNAGPDAAQLVTVTDALPAATQFVSAQSGCTESAGTVTCALGTLADGANASTTITVRAVGAGAVVNSATVSSSAADPDPADNPASAAVLVGPTADLSIAKTGPATVTAGGRLTYTLTARNQGPSAATGATVTDTLPAGMTYESFTSSQGSCARAGATVTCALGSLVDGATATVTITVTATFALSGQSVPNSASITGDQNDDDPADNLATHAVDVAAAADLTLSKDAPAEVPAGGHLLYSLQVGNSGQQSARDVRVTDALPAGVSFVSATASQGSCAAAGQTVTCAIGDLGAGAGAQVLLTVQVSAGLAGRTVRNTAVASSATTEIDPATNTDDASTAVEALPPAPDLTPPAPGAPPPSPAPAPAAAAAPTSGSGDLKVTKTADAGATAVFGLRVAFTIRVANRSASTAHGVIAIDQPSAPVTLNSIRPDRGTCTDLRCNLGSLASGEVVRIHVVMTPMQTGLLRNSVVVSSDEGERGSADNADVAAVRIAARPTTLRLTQRADRRVVKAGQTVWFTLTARNTGSSAAANVRVCDTPAHNTTFVTVSGAKFSKGRACWTVAMLAPGRSVSYRVKLRVSSSSRAARAFNPATLTASNASTRRARRSVRVIARNVLRGGGVTG